MKRFCSRVKERGGGGGWGGGCSRKNNSNDWFSRENQQE